MPQLLHRYVESHWSQSCDKYQAPETPAGAKAEIRTLLPAGLTQEASKVRSSVAYAIAAIAHWDFPEQWPDLFNILMEVRRLGGWGRGIGLRGGGGQGERNARDIAVQNVLSNVLPIIQLNVLLNVMRIIPRRPQFNAPHPYRPLPTPT